MTPEHGLAVGNKLDRTLVNTANHSQGTWDLLQSTTSREHGICCRQSLTGNTGSSAVTHL